MRLLRTATLAAPLLAIVLAGCGNWSNEDLVFIAALPDRETLRARVPEASAKTSELGTRKDGLTLRESSPMYEKTVGAARAFNSVLFAILEVVERVIQSPPTKREPDQRTWGPAVDWRHPDRHVRLVVTRGTREPDQTLVYTWHIDTKRRADGEDAWVEVVGGAFEPSEDLSRGEGNLTFNALRVRDAGFANADDDPNMRSIRFEYDTLSDRRVRMVADFRNADLESQYAEAADGSGSLLFQLVGDFVPGPFPASETLTVATRWVSNGAGRSDAHADGGDVTVPTEIGSECWDATYRTVWFEEIFDLDGNGTQDGTAGDPAACAIAE